MNKFGIFICGAPSELTIVEKEGRTFQPLSLFSTKSSDIDSTFDYLFCDYPKRSGEVDVDTKNGKLPKANGLSGAFAIKIPNPAGKEDHLWSLEGAKVIALQVSWDTATYLNVQRQLKFFLHCLT